MQLLEICQQIQGSSIGTSIRESTTLFPVVESVHVLALAVSVGLVMWFDLRLMGVSMRNDAVSQVFRQLRAWMVAGFCVMFVTGLTMFWALAANLYASPYFRVKMGLLVLAGLNIAVYHATVDRRRAEWDGYATPPVPARLAGLLSLLLWIGVIVAGRFTAYNV